MCERDRKHGEAVWWTGWGGGGGGCSRKSSLSERGNGEKQTFDFSLLRKVAAEYFYIFISKKHGANFNKIQCIVR